MPMTLQEQIHLLSMVDILGPLSPEEMEDLAKRTPDTFLEEGDVLYSPQDGTERLFILKKGRVQVYELDRSGEEITLSVVEGGAVFGEMALTGQRLEGVYVRALAPSTVVSLKREELEGLIMKKPEVGLRLVREASQEAARFRGPLRRYRGQGRPRAPGDPYPGPGRLGGFCNQRELPHPHPLHPRADRHDDRLQAGGRQPGVRQAQGDRGGPAQGAPHPRQGPRYPQGPGRGRVGDRTCRWARSR